MIRGWAALAATLFAIGVLSLPPAMLGHQAESTPLAGTPIRVLGETPGAVPVSLMIELSGSEDDRLLGGNSPLARRVALHHTPLVDGMRQMTPAPEGIVIPAGSMTLFEPERDHLMLVGLRQSLVQGQTFPLTLRFAQAGDVTVTVRVRRRVDAAGVTPVPPLAVGDLTLSLASAPPAAAITASPVAH